jgi:hypothetical protein
MEDLFAANPRKLKLPTTGPALLPVLPVNRQQCTIGVPFTSLNVYIRRQE